MTIDCAGEDAGIVEPDEDWVSLEYLYQAFPSTPENRNLWRTAVQEIYYQLKAQGHHGLPALIPGLVHARVATALLAAGYRSNRNLRHQSFLCLGCHAGLEVRILRDLGAGRVYGLEIRRAVVESGMDAHLIESGEVAIADYWEVLHRPNPSATWDTIMLLAPEDVSLQVLWDTVRPHLVPGGRLAVVAQMSDVKEIPQEAYGGAALEGTMRWLGLRKG